MADIWSKVGQEGGKQFSKEKKTETAQRARLLVQNYLPGAVWNPEKYCTQINTTGNLPPDDVAPLYAQCMGNSEAKRKQYGTIGAIAIPMIGVALYGVKSIISSSVKAAVTERISMFSPSRIGTQVNRALSALSPFKRGPRTQPGTTQEGGFQFSPPPGVTAGMLGGGGSEESYVMATPALSVLPSVPPPSTVRIARRTEGRPAEELKEWKKILLKFLKEIYDCVPTTRAQINIFRHACNQLINSVKKDKISYDNMLLILGILHGETFKESAAKKTATGAVILTKICKSVEDESGLESLYSKYEGMRICDLLGEASPEQPSLAEPLGDGASPAGPNGDGTESEMVTVAVTTVPAAVAIPQEAFRLTYALEPLASSAATAPAPASATLEEGQDAAEVVTVTSASNPPPVASTGAVNSAAEDQDLVA